ncbi:hypothetical protein FNF29_02097 [Cafeteria roenbergensis]|uniref:Cilia- and flagella-associated protein 43 n=1 Tax=Cafeteria roenbergensis TaxID=33653 RepID=A0A5A8CPH2_CAFRO|nr:hypothetical protein FNF29_02097 [Cafeteria roenbergensis]|eukprot:KAA0154953.1 hypothetical protein FNF29_02097 [Cafeteria roenbergensis]
MFLEASIEAPKALAAVSDDVVAFPSQRAVAFVGDGPPEMLPIDAPGQVTAMSGTGASGILAVVARSENPSVILVSTADRTVHGVLNGAGSLDVDAVALSHDGTRALTFSSDEGYGAVAWDVVTGQMLPGAAAHIPASPTTAASFHPRDRSIACAITPAGIFFWHITVSGDGSTRLQAIPGILPDESLDRISLASSAVAELRSMPAPAPLDGSDVVPPPATGLLSPEGLAMHGIAAAVDVASGAPDPASGAGLVPGSDTIPLLQDEAAGSKALAGLASPSTSSSAAAAAAAAHARAAATAAAGAPGTGAAGGAVAGAAGAGAAQGPPHGAVGAGAGGGDPAAAPGAAGRSGSAGNPAASSAMPWEDDSAAAAGSSSGSGSAVTGSAVAWSEAMTSGAPAPWLSRRRFISHCWLPDGRVLAGVASGWLLLFDPVTGRCVGAAPPQSAGVRVTALLSLAGSVLVGRSDGRIESRALPALEVAGSLDLSSPSPVALTLGSRRLAAGAGAVRSLVASPSFHVVFASTAAGGIFRIDLRPPGQDDDDDDAAAPAVAAGAAGRESGTGKGLGAAGTADGGVAMGGLAAHGEMASSVIGVARPLQPGPAGPILALRPLATPPPAEGDEGSASGHPHPPALMAALDACGLVSVYDVATPAGTQLVAGRRFVFEPATIATSSGTAALPAPWEDEGALLGAASAAAGTSSAGFLAAATSSGHGHGHAASSVTGLATTAGLATMAGDGRTATPSLPVAGQCLDTHGRLPLLAVGTDSGCVHVLVAATNGSARGCLTPASAGALAPGVTLTDVAATRAHTGAVSAVSFCPHPSLPLLAAVSDTDRAVTFHLVHVPDQAPALATDGAEAGGPLMLLPVGTASLPPSLPASAAGAPAQPGQGLVCAACWRVDASGSGAAELLVSFADGSIAAVSAPSLEAVEHARAAVDAAAAEGAGVSAALVAGTTGAHWPVDTTSSVLVHAPDAGHAAPIVAMSTGPFGTGQLLAASPAVATVLVVPTPWAPGSGEAAEGAAVTEHSSGAALSAAGDEPPASARSQLSGAAAEAPPPPSKAGAEASWRVASDLGAGSGRAGAVFPREASAGEEAGMLALAASATSSGLAVATVNAAGSAALAFVSQEAGGALAGAGGSATPSVGRSAAAAPFHGTCVAIAPCGTRVVVGTTEGAVVVASVSDTRLKVFERKAATPSADEAATGARFQLLAEAVGHAACLGSRAAFAGAPGQAASGALTSVSGAGEAVVWLMGVGMAATAPSADKGLHGDGWEADMVQQSAPRSKSALGGGEAEESKHAFFESGAGSDGGTTGVEDGPGSMDVAAAAAAAASCLEWAHSVEEARAEALAEPFREALRERLGELAHRVAELVESNAEAPELERLGREEFAVDEEGSAAHDAVTQELVAAQLAATEADIAESEREAADLKRECWDAVERPLEAVHALGGGGEERVWSMAVRRLSPEDERLLGKLALLRRMEQAEMAESAEGAVEELPGGDLAWPGLASDLPADADWLVNAGAIPPALDPVAQREALAQRQAKEKADAAAAAAAAGAGDGSAGAAAAAAAAAAAQANAGDESEDGTGSSAADGGVIGRASGWAGEGVTKLLYHPLSCRTGAQRRLQIRLLEQLTREVARSFNRRFDALKRAKLDDVERISERNKRTTKILELLGRTEELYEPPRFEDERPEALLEASREEVGFDEWEPPAVVKAREEEARRRAEEAAKHKDDAPERALDDMMSGTLEEKDEVQRAEDAMRAGRQPWMDDVELALLARAGVMEAETAPVLAAIQAEALGVQPDQEVDEALLRLAKEALDSPDSADSLPEEQRGPFRNYRARIAELLQLREERRVRLEEELAALKAEVKTIIQEFDARLAEAQQQYREFREAILIQEAYAHRLAAAVAGSDANLEREQYVLERLATFTTAADREASALPGAEQAFAEAQRQLEEARAAEADMERSFREAVRSRSEHGLDSDTMRRLVDMFHHSRHDVSFELAGARAAALGRDPRRGAVSVAREAVGELATADGGAVPPLPFSTGGGGAHRGAASATLSHDPAAGAPTGPPPTEDELFAEAERRATAEPTSDMLPDDLVPGVTVDEAVWAEAVERWRQKVSQELHVARLAAACDRAAAVVSSIRAALARAQGKVHALEDERNALLRANALTANDVDVMIRLRQGQDEVAGLAAIPDYGEALLVPTRIVESENVGTRRAGRRVARRLERVREARKDLRYRQWMREYAEGRMQDREEWMRDVSLLRVTKELQQFVGGADLAQKQKELTVKTEAQGRYLKTAHRRVMGKQQRAQKRLERSVQSRREENERLLKQVTELEQSVAVRAGIVEARERGAGGGVGPTARADKRMGTLVARSRLVSTAKAQADELDALRAQLAKLRRRTFPMFVAGQT